jgi:lysine 2,3-aminomutase
MDLVGNDVPQVTKLKFQLLQKDRYEQMLDYLRVTPSVRDVVVSGGDLANLPIGQVESFVSALMDLPNIKDIRLATKGLMGIPQHFLQDEVLQGLERLAKKARERGVDIAVHTHVNNARQVTPLVAKASKKLLEIGFRDVRNQGVLLRGVNTSPKELLDLCFTLLDQAKIMPYYFYQCDMIPNAEHWRLAVHEAQQLQHDIMGYLPGFESCATCLSLGSGGYISSRITTARRGFPTGRRTTKPELKPTMAMPSRAATSITTPSIRCLPPARIGGASTLLTRISNCARLPS